MKKYQGKFEITHTNGNVSTYTDEVEAPFKWASWVSLKLRNHPYPLISITKINKNENLL